MRLGISAKGKLTLYNGAVDIGQGSNTILIQIAADALGLPMRDVEWVMGDTGRTADAGKTSASRQTFVSGKAVELAALQLRENIFRAAGAPDNEWADRRFALSLEGAAIVFRRDGITHRLSLSTLPADANGDVLHAEGRFDPPTEPLDSDGQGIPYASYAFAAQMAEVEIDLELGTTRVLRVVAAHDVGRAINPTQVEGQIHGGTAQGLGLALMESYVPGRTENLHDYLIPTIGDIPPIECVLVEDPEPLGPYGAKGVGEPGLIPTAPAILGAIDDSGDDSNAHVLDQQAAFQQAAGTHGVAYALLVGRRLVADVSKHALDRHLLSHVVGLGTGAMGLDHVDLGHTQFSDVHAACYGVHKSFAVVSLTDGIAARFRGRVGPQKPRLGIAIALVLKDRQNGSLAHVEAIVLGVERRRQDAFLLFLPLQRGLCLTEEVQHEVGDGVFKRQDDDPAEPVMVDQGLHIHHHLEAAGAGRGVGHHMVDWPEELGNLPGVNLRQGQWQALVLV